jgi:hypothetical protein
MCDAFLMSRRHRVDEWDGNGEKFVDRHPAWRRHPRQRSPSTSSMVRNRTLSDGSTEWMVTMLG